VSDTTKETETEQTWDTDALRRDFEVLGFAMGFCVVRRRSDGKKGSLEFNKDYPRLYRNFVPHEEG
jgi:hypothetical protein